LAGKSVQSLVDHSVSMTVEQTDAQKAVLMEVRLVELRVECLAETKAGWMVQK